MQTEMKDTERTSARTWLYALAGIATGAVMGVLFAPAPGKETRSKMNDWLQHKREQARAALIQRQARRAEQRELAETRG